MLAKLITEKLLATTKNIIRKNSIFCLKFFFFTDWKERERLDPPSPHPPPPAPVRFCSLFKDSSSSLRNKRTFSMNPLLQKLKQAPRHKKKGKEGVQEHIDIKRNKRRDGRTLW